MCIIEEETTILTDWAFDCCRSSAQDSLVNDDMEALNDRLRFERVVKVALWCIQGMDSKCGRTATKRPRWKGFGVGR